MKGETLSLNHFITTPRLISIFYADFEGKKLAE